MWQTLFLQTYQKEVTEHYNNTSQFFQHSTFHSCGLHVVAGWLKTSTTIRVVTSWLIIRFSYVRSDVLAHGAPLTKRHGIPPSVANGRGCTRTQNKRKIRISLTFDCNVRSAVFFSCVLAFTSIFCFSYVSLQYHLLCQLHMYINTCIMWLSMNAVSAVKNHLQLHLVRGYDETYLNCTCCVSTFCNSPSTTVTSESSSRNLLRLFKNVSNTKLNMRHFLCYRQVRFFITQCARHWAILEEISIYVRLCVYNKTCAVSLYM